ncbi:MAG: NADH-quinone oxidoreductase subunit N [Planctomycetes bacterium]|nr:NADH-quinone oxidoreductase subunit N [Planctomycetota bacterium]
MESLKEIPVQLSILLFIGGLLLALTKVLVNSKPVMQLVQALIIGAACLLYYFINIKSFSLILVIIPLLILFTMFTILLLYAQLKEQKHLFLEVSAVVYFATAGMIFLTRTSNIAEFYLIVEMISLAIYVLIAFNRTGKYSLEAVMKYFVQGGIISALLLLGLVMLFSSTGSLDFTGIAEKNYGFYTAILFILAAIFFKLGASPLHFWVPDAYTGAIASITAFISTTLKAAVLAFLAFKMCFFFYNEIIYRFTMAFSVASMILGTFLALFQTNVKRMLAYSSIAHTGYILIGFLNGVDQFSVIFYAIVYLVMTFGAFTSLVVLEKEGIADISSFAGLGKTSPVYARHLTIMLLSLAGVPLTGGFFAKFYMISTAFNQTVYIPAIILLATTIISFYYYFRIIVYMYMKEPADSEQKLIPNSVITVMVACSVLIIILGILPLFYNFSFLYDPFI